MQALPALDLELELVRRLYIDDQEPLKRNHMVSCVYADAVGMLDVGAFHHLTATDLLALVQLGYLYTHTPCTRPAIDDASARFHTQSEKEALRSMVLRFHEMG